MGVDGKDSVRIDWFHVRKGGPGSVKKYLIICEGHLGGEPTGEKEKEMV